MKALQLQDPFMFMKTGFDLLDSAIDRANKDWFYGENSIFATVKKNFHLPYNVYSNKQGDELTIEVAVAGFLKEDLKVTLIDNILNVEGKSSNKDSTEFKYHYKGLSNRSFNVQYPLPNTWEVNSVNLQNGILKIALKRNKIDSSKILPIVEV